MNFGASFSKTSDGMQCEIHKLIITGVWRTLRWSMKPSPKWKILPETPLLTRKRMLIAFAVAVAADGLQLCLGFFGWAFGDQVIDVVAMVVITRLIGFHILLLPTFIAELVPVVDDLPTWTACVAVVIALRRREQNSPAAPPPDKPVIDI